MFGLYSEIQLEVQWLVAFQVVGSLDTDTYRRCSKCILVRSWLLLHNTNFNR